MSFSGDVSVKGSRVGLDVVVGLFSGESALSRSKRDPGKIIICAQTGSLAHNGSVIRLHDRKAFLLLMALLARGGGVVLHDDIWFLLWGDQTNGGPENPRNYVQVLLGEVKPAAAMLGYRIEVAWGQGFRALPIETQPVLQAAE